MIIQPTIVDTMPSNFIDAIAYKLYQSLGITRVPIDPDVGINCGGQTPNSVNWDGFCIGQWHKGWAVFSNLSIWIVVIVVVILILRRKFILKQK